MSSLVLVSWCVFLSLVTACLGDEGSLGPQRFPEPQVSLTSLEPQVSVVDAGSILCKRGEAFCDSANLSYCSRSGTDAVSFGACAGGTANNPAGCFMTDCPGGATACCRPGKATCRWSFTSPAISGQTYGFDENRDKENYCVAPSTCDQNSLTFYIAPPKTTGTCPVMVGRSVHVIIGRPLPPLGQIVTLPDSRFFVSSGGTPTSCSAWTGTLIVHSDVPTWRVSLDLTCSDPNLRDLRLVGSASGDV